MGITVIQKDFVLFDRILEIGQEYVPFCYTS